MTTEFDYSLRVKNGAAWRAFPRVRLMISVGKEYHEGKKLEAVVNWINRNKHIQEVHVSVNDYLQRHNFIAAGMTPDEAGRVALSEGSLWLARNEGTLAEIKAPRITTRWNDWYEQPAFEAVHRELLGFACQDAGFENAMAYDALSLAERKASRGEKVPVTLVAHSQNYVEEEIPVFAMQTEQLPAAEIYPGSNLAGAEYMLGLSPAAKAELPEAIRPLSRRHYTRVDFSRINVAQAPDPSYLLVPELA